MGEQTLAEKYKVDIPEGQSGDWRVKRFTIENDMRLWRLQLQGRAPKEGETYTRLIHNSAHDPVMSDTPAEIGDLIPALIAFKETWVTHVLINGLGLGIVLKMALAQPHVEHIDVVEIEPDIIKLVAPSYPDPRIHIHEGDAYTIQWPKGMSWSVAWHDIWPTICTDNLEGMSKLHRRYGKRVQWQDSWMRDYLKAQQRRERDYWF
jgi:hypothetical protein